MSLGIESLKNWVDYWRKFKGKKVRIWFVRKDRSSIGQYECSKEELVDTLKKVNPSQVEEFKENKLILRDLDACACVDGRISDVVDSPFGIMLAEIKFWRLSKPDSKYEHVFTQPNKEIEQIFIPMSEIARIDFLAVVF
jgi:hypothetical protein